MIFVAHRINKQNVLASIPQEFGVEVDVRDQGQKLILCHDPFADGEDFEAYLQTYKHKLLIVNVKSFGIEKAVGRLLRQNHISDFFLLDSAMGAIVNSANQIDMSFAGRVSEFEPVENVILMQNLINWVWVDCFNKLTLTPEVFTKLKRYKSIKICLTSPDLLGRPEDIPFHAEFMNKHGIIPDAICTKFENIKVWKKMLKF